MRASFGEESHLSKAAFADDFEIIKIIGFDPNTEKKVLVPTTTIDNKHWCLVLIRTLTGFHQPRNFVLLGTPET